MAQLLLPCLLPPVERTMLVLPRPRMGILSRAVVACLTFCCPAILAAQDVGAFLSARMGFSPSDMVSAASGAPVIKLLPGAVPEEVAFFAAIVVDAPYGSVSANLLNASFWAGSAISRAGFGFFASPATAMDARGLFVTAEEAREAKSCTPGHCGIKLPVSSMATVRSAIDWAAPHPEMEASRLARESLARYVNEYRLVGAGAMVRYADTDPPGNSALVSSRLLRQSPLLDEFAPGLLSYLSHYPGEGIAGSRGGFYWSLDRFQGLRPITLLTHMVSFAVPGKEICVLSERQLYASHYFDGSLAVTVVAAEGGRTWMMSLRRFEFDRLPSGGLLNIRGRATARLRDAVRAELLSRRLALENKR